MNGTWIATFPQVDSVDRGLIESAELVIYCTATRPDIVYAHQRNGLDPFFPLNEGALVFVEERPRMESGERFATNIHWILSNDSRKHCHYNAWLQTPGQRVKLHSEMTHQNQTFNLSYVPSVFQTGTAMNLTIESLIDGCGISRTVAVDYVHNWSTVGHVMNFGLPLKTYEWTSNDTVRVPLADWRNPAVKFRITWNQNLTQLIDDGYSCSACISLIIVDTRQVVRRVFERNLGEVDGWTPWLNGHVPTNRKYRLEISPSSAMREGFKPLYVYLEMVPVAGTYHPYKPPFTTGVTAGIVIVFILNFAFVGAQLYFMTKLREARGEEAAPFRAHKVGTQIHEAKGEQFTTFGADDPLLGPRIDPTSYVSERRQMVEETAETVLP
jgi:hypothetical protein